MDGVWGGLDIESNAKTLKYMVFVWGKGMGGRMCDMYVYIKSNIN